MNEPQELVILSREESGVRKKQILRRFAPQNDKLFVGIAIRESRCFAPLRVTNSFLPESSCRLEMTARRSENFRVKMNICMLSVFRVRCV